MKTDSQLQQDVLDEMKWNPSVTHTNIGVAVKNGIVTLTGHVPHFMEKTAAEDAAQRICGVKAIANEIEVRILGIHKRDDEDIAKAALSSLKWNVQVPEDIKVAVDDGWVTLKGEVEWEYQRAAAETSVRYLYGVKAVINEIQIKSRVKPTDIKKRIEDALKRSAEMDGHGISVLVDGNRVTLSGKVRSFAEMQDARLAAWAAPGVTTVENKLRLAA